jgi:hypothetical protein
MRSNPSDPTITSAPSVPSMAPAPTMVARWPKHFGDLSFLASISISPSPPTAMSRQAMMTPLARAEWRIRCGMFRSTTVPYIAFSFLRSSGASWRSKVGNAIRKYTDSAQAAT